MKPEIRYTKSGSVSIAYSVIGEGPRDLLIVPGFISHIELLFQEPLSARFFSRLASFARLIAFDKRGTGLSDRGVGVAPLDLYVSDAKAVMDAVGIERADIMGISEGAAIALLFAATHPERTSSVIIYGGQARVVEAPEYPEGVGVAMLRAFRDYIVERWGTGVGLRAWAPSAGDDPEAREHFGTFQRMAASPGDVRDMFSSYELIDVRHVLGTINAPTLVVHRKGDRMVPVERGRYLADWIAGARMVEVEGPDHIAWIGDQEAILGEIEEFLTGVRGAPETTRRLATIMFTDIVGSTERAAEIGDRAWRELLERHDAMVRRSLAQCGGREIKSTGDGFLAVFEGPTAALGATRAIEEGGSALGVEIRAGLHTGEIEMIGEDIGGIAVHIARRVADLSGPGEVWVSATVPGLVAGSRIEFRDRGDHGLRGIPERWRLFSVDPRKVPATA